MGEHAKDDHTASRADAPLVVHNSIRNCDDNASVWSTDASTATTGLKVFHNEHESVRLVDFRSRRDGSSPRSCHQSSTSAAAMRSLRYLSLGELTYDADDSIAEGSFGAMHKGYWLDSLVITKFLGYEGDRGSITTRLFLREVQMWLQLKHPHIIGFLGACHVQKRYIVCEYAPYDTLRQYLKLDENKHSVWEKLSEVALGLRYLHKRNIAHNDLRCNNILIGADKNAKLPDFGLSSIPGVVEITIKKNQIGAARWKSPEFGYRLKKGLRPIRPATMAGKQVHLIERMACNDPQKRVEAAYVARRLSEFARDA
uniref:Protein kinase domain-containing protein n=1 Tax=Globisporangium ultimum (strain ATCC 200006 / CBS 805.95 / DAOM BR144) TaxID=431595 RepID=K3XDM6_GLOUD